jgi:hypothetical protein
MADMTLALAADRLSELVAAAERLASVALQMGDAEALRGLTCTEAEAIADVCRAVGRDDAAEVIVETHGTGDDDEGDDHHDIYLADRALHARLDAEAAGRRLVAGLEDIAEGRA